MVYVYAIVK